MKAKELMIDDWVSYIGDSERKQRKVLEITSLRQVQLWDGENMPSWFLVGEKYIEPISLTPEILVANGFESRELYHFTLYQLGKESFSIAYDLLLKNLCAFTKTVQAGCRICTTPDKSELSIQIQYVHELQQAMRLIGLRDLADNFVIEKGGCNGN